MSVGDRIRFYRKQSGLTQQQLGEMIGFSQATAHVRIAQYESNTKRPKIGTLEKIAHALKINVNSLTISSIETKDDLLQLLFFLEDEFGFQVVDRNGEKSLIINPEHSKYKYVNELLCKWYEEAEKYRRGEIKRTDYNLWRICYNAFRKACTYDFICIKTPPDGNFLEGKEYSGKYFASNLPRTMIRKGLERGYILPDEDMNDIPFGTEEIKLYFKSIDE